MPRAPSRLPPFSKCSLKTMRDSRRWASEPAAWAREAFDPERYAAQAVSRLL